jgi:hypothetical protein
VNSRIASPSPSARCSDSFVSAQKIEALRIELIRAGLDLDAQAPYEVGPPISPLHS